MTRKSLPTAARPYVRLEAETDEPLASVSRDAVRELYMAHGALLLRGFASRLEDFRQFAVDLCPVAVHNESRNRVTLGPTQDVQTVSLGTGAFPLHSELSREPWRPDTCFFYCINPPAIGGMTTIGDGVAIASNLPPGLKDRLADRRIKYIQLVRPEELQFWLGTSEPDDAELASPPPHCPYGFERIGGQVARVFTRPLLHRPMFTGELAFANFLLFARFLRGRILPLEDGTSIPDEWLQTVKQVSDQLTVPIEWQRGDLLVLDNSRFMHGRTPVTPGDGRLIATYFGYVDFGLPDEEPPNAIWRRPGFHPPLNSKPAN